LARQQRWAEAADWLHAAIQAGTQEFLCAACHELLAQAEPRLRAIGRLALQRITTRADGNG
jgi:hypothetical protein